MIKKVLPYLLSILILAGAILVVNDHGNDRSQEKPTSDESTVNREMRGLWVTYMTLDVEGESDPKAAFRDRIDAILADMKAGGFNTMIVQVRPFCDAIYRSAYYPWSHIITGTQGTDPGFDPLAYICEESKRQGISVHAWVNPYRVSTDSTPAQLSEENPAVLHSDIKVEINGKQYLNPASEKTRELIVNGVIELVERYDIDGVQFDDYFYPEDCGDFDRQDYETYCKKTSSPLSLDDFRRNNVNTLIRDVYSAVHSADPDAVFGISPQGNLKNNKLLYADVKKWCGEDGYIDYICPQIYFSLDNPAMTYEDSLTEWVRLKKHKGLSLYVGLAGYKAGTDADSGTWLDNSDVLATELDIARESGCGGFMLYSYDSLHNDQNAAEIKNLIRYLNSSPSQESS